MTNMILVEDKGEAAIVATFFGAVQKHIEAGRTYKDTIHYSEERNGFTDFQEGGVFIPYGSLVYVYREVGGGEAVYDAYSFGYMGVFAVSKDIEGDLAGLVNAGCKFFPF